MLILLIAAIVITVGVLAWALCRAAARVPPAPEQPEAWATDKQRKKHAYTRGMCPHCGELDVILRADGEPSTRWHPWPCWPPIDPANVFTIGAQPTEAAGRHDNAMNPEDIRRLERFNSSSLATWPPEPKGGA